MTIQNVAPSLSSHPSRLCESNKMQCCTRVGGGADGALSPLSSYYSSSPLTILFILQLSSSWPACFSETYYKSNICGVLVLDESYETWLCDRISKSSYFHVCGTIRLLPLGCYHSTFTTRMLPLGFLPFNFNHLAVTTRLLPLGFHHSTLITRLLPIRHLPFDLYHSAVTTRLLPLACYHQAFTILLLPLDCSH